MGARLWVLRRSRRSSLGRSHAAETPTAALHAVMPEAGDITGTGWWDLAGPAAGARALHARRAQEIKR